MIEEKMEIERIVKKKQEEKDLIEIRMVEKIVPKRLHKYLKVCSKKKKDISIVKNRERRYMSS